MAVAVHPRGNVQRRVEQAREQARILTVHLAAGVLIVDSVGRTLAIRAGMDAVLACPVAVGQVVVQQVVGAGVGGILQIAAVAQRSQPVLSACRVRVRKDGADVGIVVVVTAQVAFLAVVDVGTPAGAVAVAIEVVTLGGDCLGLRLTAVRAGVGHDARAGAGRLSRHDARIPAVRAGLGQRADKLRLAAAGAHTIHMAVLGTGGRGGRFQPSMAGGGLVVILVGVGVILVALVQGIALLSAGGRDDRLGEGVLLGRDDLGVGIAAASTGKGTHTVLLVGGFLRHNTRIVAVAGGGDNLSLGVGGVTGAGIDAFAVRSAGGGGGDDALAPVVTECRDDLCLRCTVAGTGVGALAVRVTGGGGGDDALAPVVTQRCGLVALLGQALVLITDVEGIAAALTGGGYRLALMPRLFQHRDSLGSGRAAVLTGEQPFAGGVDGGLFRDDALVIAVGQLGGVVGLVGQAGLLVALVDGVAFGHTSRGNYLLHMVGLVQLGKLLGSGCSADLTGEGLFALRGIGRRLRDDALAPVVTGGGLVVVVVVGTTPLGADVLIVANLSAGGRVIAHREGIPLRGLADGLRGSRVRNHRRGGRLCAGLGSKGRRGRLGGGILSLGCGIGCIMRGVRLCLVLLRLLVRLRRGRGLGSGFFRGGAVRGFGLRGGLGGVSGILHRVAGGRIHGSVTLEGTSGQRRDTGNHQHENSSGHLVELFHNKNLFHFLVWFFALHPINRPGGLHQLKE